VFVPPLPPSPTSTLLRRVRNLCKGVGYLFQGKEGEEVFVPGGIISLPQVRRGRSTPEREGAQDGGGNAGDDEVGAVMSCIR